MKKQLSNLVNGKPAPVMHGENMLTPIGALPEGQTTQARMYIVGHSESGHNHVLKSKTNMEVLEADGKRYVLIKEVAELFHQKTFDIHESVTVEPGVYEITHKSEYDPWQKIVRAVYD